MKFSATVTLQYPTVFSAFSVEDYLKGLDWIRDSGLDGAELCISHYKGLDLGIVKKQLEERKLGCSTLSTGQARGMEGLSLVGVKEEIKKKTQERFMQHIDAAAYLGSKVTMGLMRASDRATMQDLGELAEATKPIVEYADKKGFVIAIEPINRYETSVLNSVDETMDFIENCLGNPDNVGILWDLFHANIEDVDYRRCIARMGKRLVHVHLADSNRMFPGYGHTDVKGILALIRDSGFEEYASFECLNLPSRHAVLNETGPWVNSVREEKR